MSMSCLVILAASIFEYACGKTDRQTQKLRWTPYWRDCRQSGSLGSPAMGHWGMSPLLDLQQFSFFQYTWNLYKVWKRL